MFTATFNLVARVRLIVKDGSLFIHSLESYNFFHLQRPLSKCCRRFVKMVNKVNDFLSKSPKFCVVWFGSSFFVQISPAYGKNIIKELQIVFQTLHVNNSNGNMERLECKLQCKKVVIPIGLLQVCYRCKFLTWEVQNITCNSLIGICATGQQNVNIIE